MRGRTPWAKIRGANELYLPDNARNKDYVLDDPSRMSESAVRAYLKLWHECQKHSKGHALLFRNPESSSAPAGNAGEGRRTSGVKMSESRDVSEDRDDIEDRNGEGASKNKECEVGSHDGGGGNHARSKEGEGSGTHGGEGGNVNVMILRDVGESKEERMRFLKSLSTHADYKWLLDMMQKATVSLHCRLQAASGYDAKGYSESLCIVISLC